MLYSTLLYSTILLYSTLLYSTVLYNTRLYSAKLYDFYAMLCHATFYCTALKRLEDLGNHERSRPGTSS